MELWYVVEYAVEVIILYFSPNILVVGILNISWDIMKICGDVCS